MCVCVCLCVQVCLKWGLQISGFPLIFHGVSGLVHESSQATGSKGGVGGGGVSMLSHYGALRFRRVNT